MQTLTKTIIKKTSKIQTHTNKKQHTNLIVFNFYSPNNKEPVLQSISLTIQFIDDIKVPGAADSALFSRYVFMCLGE